MEDNKKPNKFLIDEVGQFDFKTITDEELQALVDEEEEYVIGWRNSLTQEQINSI
jgi:hypothetical protein